MTERRAAAVAAADQTDSDYLRELGVEPRLRRALGFFTGSLFAIAFQGPTTGALLVTGATLALGGPAFIWAIPLIYVFQLLVAFLWAELSSHYPLTGGIYQWARQLGGDFVGWTTGLFYLVGIVLVMPAVGTVMNVVLSGLFTSLKVTTASEVIIAIITTLVAALLIATSVRVVALINSIGVVLEIVVLVGAAIGLLLHTHQSISVLGNTGGTAATHSYLYPFMIVIALVVTQLVGFETAGAFAEETTQARIKPSQAIIAGLTGTAILIFLFDLALLLAIPGVKPAMSNPELIPSVLTAALGSTFEKLFLVGALISVASTAIATLATIARTIYGMARNNQLPGSGFLTRLSPKTDEPFGSVIIAALLSMIPLIFIKRVEVIVASITAMIVVPYVIVIAALIYRRLHGWPATPARFSLKAFGLPLSIISLAWTVFVIIDAAWPRPSTNPHLGPFPVIEEIAAGTLIVAVLWWVLVLRKSTGNHPALSPPATAAAGRP